MRTRHGGPRRGWLALLWVTVACLSARGAEAERLRVLTSFLPVYCFTAGVAGDLADVQNLLPGAVGPHDYQPTRSDYDKLAAARILVVNGLKLEDWLQPMLKSRPGLRPITVVPLSAGMDPWLIREVPGLDLLQGKGGKEPREHAEGDPNPHVWLDPALAAHGVTNILRALQQADPANAGGYESNAVRYVERLQRLDAELRSMLAPVRSIPFIAYHDAFVYPARRYGLNVAAVIEQVPEVTPSLRYQGALRTLIREKKVRAIFAEPQFPRKIAEQLSADSGIPLGFLDTLETPASGRLTPSAYEEGMRANARVLANLLK
jgi:zinc/manganese transport system substrate-binding protein